MIIRDYVQTDWDAIERIHDRARMIELRFADIEAAFLPLRIAAELEHLFNYTGLFVAEIDDKVVGFVACNESELAWLYVEPSLMRKGIGRSLCDYAFAKFPNIGHIEALVGNLPAKALYESYGFVVADIEQGRMPGNEKYIVNVYSFERF